MYCEREDGSSVESVSSSVFFQEITIFRRADKVRKNYQAALSHHNPSLLSDGSGNSKVQNQPQQLQQEEEEEEGEVKGSTLKKEEENEKNPDES